VQELIIRLREVNGTSYVVGTVKNFCWINQLRKIWWIVARKRRQTVILFLDILQN